MKKTHLIIPAALLAMTSCIDSGSSFTADYVFQDTGEYENASEIFKDGKDYYLFPLSSGSAYGAFAIGNTIAYFSTGGENMLSGGFALSRQSWKEATQEEGTDTGDGSDSGSSTPAEPGEYSVYCKDETSTVNTFLYFRQSGYMAEHDIAFLPTDIGTCTPAGMYVCNSAATVRAILGENVSGDVFNLNGKITLTATGYLNGEVTGTTEPFILAGKGLGKPDEETSAQRDSIVTSWSTMDLSKLGTVDYIDLDLESSDPADASLLQNFDVCIDNFTAQIHLSY